MRAWTAMGAASVVLLAGCASVGEGRLDPSAPGVIAREGPGLAQARERLQVGTSTREAVRSALGPAGVITFDSGWQVWVYRWPAPRGGTAAASELVLLFGPDGLLRKLRVREGLPAG